MRLLSKLVQYMLTNPIRSIGLGPDTVLLYGNVAPDVVSGGLSSYARQVNFKKTNYSIGCKRNNPTF